MTKPTFTPRSLRRSFAVALLGLGGIASAVEPSAPPASAPGPSARPGSSIEPITALIGDAECDVQSQCRTVGVGVKPCGGPNAYLAWSTKMTDPTALQSAVEAHASAEKEANQRSGLVSNCMVTPEPPAVCRPRASDGKKTCQLGQGGVRSAV